MTTCIEVNAVGYNYAGSLIPIEDGCLASATITPSGANQVTAMATTQAPNDSRKLVCTITADENVSFKIGPPAGLDATVAAGRQFMSAGGVRSFAYLAGWEVAVVTR